MTKPSNAASKDGCNPVRECLRSLPSQITATYKRTTLLGLVIFNSSELLQVRLRRSSLKDPATKSHSVSKPSGRRTMSRSYRPIQPPASRTLFARIGTKRPSNNPISSQSERNVPIPLKWACRLFPNSYTSGAKRTIDLGENR